MEGTAMPGSASINISARQEHRVLEDQAMSLSLQVFVSHSRSEAVWIDALRLREEILVGHNRWNFWVDATDIVSGDLWTERVKAAIKRADAALLLVGPDFMNSEPVFKTELPAIRDRWGEGLPLVCVPIKGYDRDGHPHSGRVEDGRTGAIAHRRSGRRRSSAPACWLWRPGIHRSGRWRRPRSVPARPPPPPFARVG